jgi:DNA polymerase IV
MTRCIAHLDMDAFFASVEQLDDPALRGKPVIIGRDPRGVVSAASYEARAFGIRSAMPVIQARKLCPQGHFLPGRMRRYSEVSKQIMELLQDIAPVVEQASVDEAYIDLTGTERLFGTPREWGMRVRERVRESVGLSCSVGIAPLKFLAKIASDMDKPGGLTIIEPQDVPAVLASLPVGKIPGVGKRTLDALRRLGVATAGDMLRWPEDFWERQLGKHGLDLLAKARGIDESAVSPGRERKSVSAENTFSHDIASFEEMKKWLWVQSERVGRELRALKLSGRTVTLKIKYGDFRQITRSRTLAEPVDADELIFETAVSLLEAEKLSGRVRLIGVGVSHFGRGQKRLSLLEDAGKARLERVKKLDQAIDSIRDKFGREAVKRGRVFGFRTRREEEGESGS